MNCLSQTKIKEVLYVLLDKYAAHEMVFLSQAINETNNRTMGPAHLLHRRSRKQSNRDKFVYRMVMQ